MTPLREELRSARAGHRSARYPGDLASDVLREEARATQSPRLLLVPLLVSGLAAVLVAAVVAKLPDARPDVSGPIIIGPYPRPDLDVVASAEEEFSEELVMPGLPELPVPVSLALEDSELSPGAFPGLPSFTWSADSFAEASDEGTGSLESFDDPSE